MSVKKNVIANLAGSGWSALMGLAFVPFYIQLMGAESYGIVGVFASMLGIMSVLDLGLAQAMNREMARLSAMPGGSGRMVDTARTLEIVYWAIALVVVAVIALLANFIAYHWLSPDTLSRETLEQVFWIMALVIGLRWPVAIYAGGLNGLQKQVLINVQQAFFATMQGAGTLMILWFVEPTIQAFFWWQALVAVIQVMTLRLVLWRCFPLGGKGKFSKQVLIEVWGFAAGMTGISLAATLLMQLDKVLLSKILNLTEFGYYMFAATVAAGLYKIIGPVFTAYYPKLTMLVAKSDENELIRTYHQGCQLMAVCILPVTLVLVFFANDILELWTRNPDVVAHSSLLIVLLVIGNALNGLMNLPYALQLAYGWTKLAFYQNVVAAIILAPAIYWATLHWGAEGAAGVWIVLNGGYVLISMQLLHRRLLVREKMRWYVNDVGKILLPTMMTVVMAKMLMMDDWGWTAKVLLLASTIGFATVAAILGADAIRSQFQLLQLTKGAK